MHIQPITPNIGAEITGIDLDDKAQVSDHAAALRQALAQHQVIFFRNQALTPASQVHLARVFGTVEPVSSTFPSHPEEPHVELLISKGQRTGTDIWHADLTWQKKPPAAACLYAVEVPAVGGDTMWASMGAAYDSLQPGMRRYIDGLTAVHDWEAQALADNLKTQDATGGKYRDMRVAYPPIEQPVVLTHPVTGRRLVFVNALYTRYIRDLGHDESQSLINWLNTLPKVPEWQVRFRWRAGSVAIWDNLATQHYAINDYHPAARRMHRVAIRESAATAPRAS